MLPALISGRLRPVSPCLGSNRRRKSYERHSEGCDTWTPRIGLLIKRRSDSGKRGGSFYTDSLKQMRTAADNPRDNTPARRSRGSALAVFGSLLGAVLPD